MTIRYNITTTPDPGGEYVHATDHLELVANHEALKRRCEALLNENETMRERIARLEDAVQATT